MSGHYVVLGMVGVLFVGFTLPHFDGGQAEHPLHAPATHYTTIVSAANSTASEWVTFRAQLAQPVDVLRDTVREHLPTAPVAFVLA